MLQQICYIATSERRVPMTQRALLLTGAAAVAVICAPLHSQSRWTQPRTPDGQPDLQGIWNNSTLTQLQRPREFANKQYLSEQETFALEKRLADQGNWDRPGAPPQPGTGLGYNYVFWDAGTKLARLDGRGLTSLIIDPPDGRIPALTP